MGKPASSEIKKQWSEKIRDQQTSGLSIQKWCDKNHIAPHIFHYWKKQLSPQTFSQDSFKELVDQKKCSIHIHYQDVHLHVESSSLKQFLKVIRELAC